MPKKPAQPKPLSIVSRTAYNQLWAASALTLKMIDAMEAEGAIRLPFVGFDETLANLRMAVTGEK